MDSNISFYHNLFLVCGLLGLMCLVAAVVLFFAFDIRKILGDMLGFSKKKAMHQMDIDRAKVASEREEIRQKTFEQKRKPAIPPRSSVVPAPSDRKFEVQKTSESDLSRSRKLSEKSLEEREKSAVEEREEIVRNANASVSDAEDDALYGDDNPTAVLAENQAGYGDETLSEDEEDFGDDAPTDVLSSKDDQEPVFEGDDNPTAVLSQNIEEEPLERGDTMVLNASMLGERDVEERSTSSDIRTGFVVERQIILTHTDELIN